MKPLILHGHERPITQVKYNFEGDLLFTIAKEKEPNVYYAENGERLGTFEGHKGAIWCLDVDYETENLITGAADDSLNIWDINTGVLKNSIKTLSSVRTCHFSYDGNIILMSTDNIRNQLCEILMFDIRDPAQVVNSKAFQTISCPRDAKVTKSLWGPTEESFYLGHEDGYVTSFDLKTMKVSKSDKIHEGLITDMQYNKDMTMFITASKDQKAKLFNAYSMEVIKTYETDRPLNSAAISPIRDHVLLGGGQEAAQVTTTAATKGKFEAIFVHMVFESEFTSVKGHFGPINSLAVHPDGKGYASGGEEGLVRLHKFDKEYFEFNYDY